MAQLSSPGVSVSVIDESFYTPAAPGTVPLIIVASEEGKQNGAGTGTAAGTLKANAGKVYLLTSQKDLSDTFGTPVFKTDANNNPIHAGEQNEYGLQAAYSFLGVSNRAYVVRADMDLGQLNATAVAPAGDPVDGSFWFDTANTKFGVFEWNSADATVTGGQSFSNVVPTVITSDTQVLDLGDGFGPRPLASVGAVGDYAVVATTTLNRLWYKKAATNSAAGTWVEVGSSEWTKSRPTVQGTISNPTLNPSNTVIINGTTFTGHASLATLVTDINTNNDSGTDYNPSLPGTQGGQSLVAGITAAVINGKLELYSDGTGANNGNIIISGTNLGAIGIAAGTYLQPALQISKHTQVPLFKATDNTSTVNGAATGSIWVKTTSPNLGADWIIKKFSEATMAWTEQAAPLYASNAAALYGRDPTGGGINLAVGALYVKYNDDEGTPAEANTDI